MPASWRGPRFGESERLKSGDDDVTVQDRLRLEAFETEVVLRDGENKEIVIGAKQVAEVRPSLASLMPSGQLAGLTAREAADLLEYLAARK